MQLLCGSSFDPRMKLHSRKNPPTVWDPIAKRDITHWFELNIILVEEWFDAKIELKPRKIVDSFMEWGSIRDEQIGAHVTSPRRYEWFQR